MVNSITLLLLLIFWFSVGQNVDSDHLDNTNLTKRLQQLPEDGVLVANDSEVDTRSRIEIVGMMEMTLSLLDGLFSIVDAIEDWILPQPRTEEDLLDGVNRVEDLRRPDEGSQYKNVEDVVVRALIDMDVVEDDPISGASDLQKLLWLERARFLNGNIILLMEGLLGQPVGGADLLANIQQKKKCDVIQIWEKMKRYNDLITNGSMAVNHFSHLGQMSNLELSRRTAAITERNVKIIDRNIQLVTNCLKRQLNETWNNVTTTHQLANQITKVLSKFYPSMRWIVAVYTNETSHSFKTKLSADYQFYFNGFHVALFPFMKGQFPIVIDGRAVDTFCRQPIREAGGMPICHVGSNDGEFIYNQLRHLGIVPQSVQLIVVPAIGQLSIRSVPPDSLPPFFLKRYPDFDIVAF